MAQEIFTNQGNTTVSSGGTTAPASGTSETWTVASSSSFPAASSAASPPTQFHIVDTATGKTSEIILVTNVSGTTWTVTRGAESSTPVAHTTGFTIQQVTTAGYLTTVTNQMTTLGDTVYGGTAGALTRLAGNTTATRKFYRQTGTGSISAAPAWDTLTAADMPSATTGALGAIELAGDLAGTATAPTLAKIQGTAVSAPSGGTTHFLNASGGWTTPAGGGGSSVLDWVSVVAEGADNTGVTDATSAFTAAIAALPSAGGVVYVPAGQYKISSTLTFHQNQGMVGDGHSASVLNYTGSAVCVHAVLSGTFDGSAEGGWFQGWQVNGYGGGSGAIGMQVTDLQGVYGNDLSFYGCSTAGLSGTTGGSGWSEECVFLKTAMIQCGTANTATTGAAVFNSTSFDYGVFEFTVVTSPATYGVVVTGGGQLEGCRLAIRGDFYANTTNTAAVLAIEPGNSSGTGYVLNCDLDIAVETSGSGTGHHLLVMGSSNAASQFNATGVMSLFPATVNGQGISNPNFLPLGFSGIINDGAGTVMAAGDALAVTGGTVKQLTGGLANALANTGGIIYAQFGDVWMVQLASGANTLTFDSLLAWTREIDLFIQQPASGAAGTVTWPSNLKWPGNTAPTLTTTSSLADWLKIKWLGTAVNFSTGVLLGKGYTL